MYKSSALYFNNTEELNKILLSLEKIDLSSIASNLYNISKIHYNWSQIAQSYKNLILGDLSQ